MPVTSDFKQTFCKNKFHCGFLHMHLNETVTVFLGDMQVKLEEEDKGEVLFLSTTWLPSSINSLHISI